MKLKKSQCLQCSILVKTNVQLENEIHELKMVLAEFKQEHAELKQELHNLRYCILDWKKKWNPFLYSSRNKKKKIFLTTDLSVSILQGRKLE